MTRTRYPLRDVQQDPVVAYCSRCGGEIYADDAIMPGCLCREHHTEAHTMSDREFFGRYHLPGGIVLDKTLCRIWHLKAKKGENHNGKSKN